MRAAALLLALLMDTWLIKASTSEDKVVLDSQLTCGQYSARWNEKECKYQIFNNGAFVTTARKREKAEVVLSELAAGAHKTQRGLAPSATSRPKRFATGVVATPSAKRRGINPHGCKGKPQPFEVPSSPAKKRRRAEDARGKLNQHSPWEEGTS